MVLAAIRRQASTGTDGDPDLWSNMVSLNHGELTLSTNIDFYVT